MNLSVQDHEGEIFTEEGFGARKLGFGVEGDGFQGVFLAEGGIFVDAEGVVREDFDALQHLIGPEMLSEGTDVLLEVAVAGDEDIAEPERPAVLLQPGGGLQGLMIAPAGEGLVSFGVEFLDIEEDKVNEGKELFHIAVPDAAVGVKAYIYALVVQLMNKGDKGFRLDCGLATGKCDPAAFPEKRLLADCHAENLLRVGFLAAFVRDGVRIGTIQAPERAALQKNDEPESRPIVSPHRFV